MFKFKDFQQWKVNLVNDFPKRSKSELEQEVTRLRVRLTLLEEQYKTMTDCCIVVTARYEDKLRKEQSRTLQAENQLREVEAGLHQVMGYFAREECS